MIKEILVVYREKGFENVIVYNHHFAPSNNYYKKLGGEVIRQDEQDADKIKVDIFSFDLDNLKNKIKLIIEKRYS